jgi:hypothetical protein
LRSFAFCPKKVGKWPKVARKSGQKNLLKIGKKGLKTAKNGLF